MKLERWLILGCLVCAAGCASRPSSGPRAPQTTTTTITSAPLSAAGLSAASWDDGAPIDAPAVGKPELVELGAQPSDTSFEQDLKQPRRDDRRPGGGFSGYK